MLYAGIDAGSRSVKIVLLDSRRRVAAAGVRDQGIDPVRAAETLLDELLAGAGQRRADIKHTVATGYARYSISADDRTTEITCHARGVKRVVPGVRTIIEAGGQDSKVIRLAADGAVRDFDMNDRCAAGTGRFIEVVAARLETDLAGLGPIAKKSRRPAAISSTCVVFAETEIIGLLASGARREDIAAGVERSVASRIAALARGRAEPPVVFTGGVALVAGMRGALSEALGAPVRVAPDPQMTGALGAALLAAQG
jgi:(R)-2-hydroxyacyl-CoA dehydratese activating ATPase